MKIPINGYFSNVSNQIYLLNIHITVMKSMLPAIIILLLFAISLELPAQQKSTAALLPVQASKSVDSLYRVKAFLLVVKHTINNHQLTEKQRVVQLDSFIHEGSKLQRLFARHIRVVLNDSAECETLERSLSFVLQSMVLLKTDLKGNNYKPGESSRGELDYMNKHIPPLVETIYHHCNWYRSKY